MPRHMQPAGCPVLACEVIRRRQRGVAHSMGGHCGLQLAERPSLAQHRLHTLRDVTLHANDKSARAVWPCDRLDVQEVPERRPALLEVQQEGVARRAGAHGVADGARLGHVSVGALQEAAVPTDDLVPAVPGQPKEGLRGVPARSMRVAINSRIH